MKEGRFSEILDNRNDLYMTCLVNYFLSYEKLELLAVEHTVEHIVEHTVERRLGKSHTW